MTTIEQLYQLYLQFPSVVIDSRKILPDCIFFAIKGKRFDGNQFAEQALAQGARYAVIDNPDFKSDDRYLLVENALTTLQSLARHHRRQFEIPLIAITGSNGKTTTKELLSAVLGSHYRTHFTKGNFNNHIGVPLTLLEMPLDTEIAIIEMGANHVGEINFLCNIARPTHGLITNIGKAHLEGFGGIEGVKKGKGELFDFLSDHNGLAFVNQDEPFLQSLAKRVPHQVYYHRSDRPDPAIQPLETSLIAETPFLEVAFLQDLQPIKIKSQLIGLYNFNNIQTAVALGRYFKVPAEKIKKAVEHYVPKNNRSQILKSGANTFILDAYNANPDSMRQAVENFAKMEGATKIAILGDMLELGEYSQDEHTKMCALALQFDFDSLILVGPEFLKAGKNFENVTCFENTGDLRNWFKKQDFENQLILLKGSRGLSLEKILD